MTEPPAPSTSQGHHMITRNKAKEHHISLATKNKKDIFKEAKTTKEALKSPHWRTPILEEIRALHNNKTWIFMPKRASINLVGSKCVFKTKLNANRTIDKYKARLVFRGFSQLIGIDFEETFCPVVKATTIRVVLSIVVSSKWRIR
ncbi:uncharacterized mitochondrial protein AtMg00820-like [Solanum dulcamara]|uniref:uncharacterized mitochondrial protein AtMg00820-like n=1 Tax=Solanum dulcamara TaxID=45834 RepID=UPI0024859F74|nr:uncharacterized mitochondrial protein AtMg00820-like [Solanum dulcamara]